MYHAALLILCHLLVVAAAAGPTEPAAEPAGAQDSSPAAAGHAVNDSGSRILHAIWIPVDEQKRPVGRTRYVSESFFAELHRRAANSQEPRHWVVTGATYRAALVLASGEMRYAVRELVAIIDFTVLDRSGPVVVPLGEGNGAWMLGEPALNGQPTEAAVVQAGRVVLSGLLPGQYRLTIPVLPGEAGPPARLDLAVAPLPTARAEITLPGDLETIRFPTARGAVVRQERPRLVEAQIGPANRLTVAWPRPAAGPVRSFIPQELFWLKVRPGRVVLDARFRRGEVDAALGQIRLTTDPRLRLLPLPEGSAVRHVQTKQGDPQDIVLELEPRSTGPLTVDVRFLVTGATGIGHRRLPHVQREGGPPPDRAFAVSVDPALQYRDVLEEPLERLEGADFREMWQESAGETPQIAYRLSDRRPKWYLATQPRKPRVTCAQTITVDVDVDEVQVVYEAGIQVLEGYVYQYRLVMPRAVVVRQVDLTEEGIDRRVRWSRGPAGRLTIFLNEPLTGQGKLVVRAVLPVAPSGEMALPAIHLDDVRITSTAVRLLRRPRARLQLTDIMGLRAQKPAADRAVSRPGTSRLVGLYEVAQRPLSATLHIAPNAVDVAGRAVTTVQWRLGRWQADVELNLQVKAGVVDDIRLDVPPSWPGPYQVEPKAAVHVPPLPGKTGRQLWIRPVTPMSGECRLRISSPLPGTGKLPPSPPDIVVRIGGPLQRFLVLPGVHQGRTIRWETKGLGRVELYAVALPAAVAPQSAVAYQVEGETFAAAAHIVPAAGEAIEVSLADIRMVVNHDGTACGVAAFDLLGQGRGWCDLVMGPASRVLRITVDGVAVPRQTGAAGRYRIPLGPLPSQRVEVMFAATRAESVAWLSRRRRIVVPGLAARGRAAEVRQTVWTVYTPRDVTIAVAQRATRVVARPTEWAAFAVPRQRRSALDLLQASVQDGVMQNCWRESGSRSVLEFVGPAGARRDKTERLVAMFAVGGLAMLLAAARAVRARPIQTADPAC